MTDDQGATEGSGQPVLHGHERRVGGDDRGSARATARWRRSTWPRYRSRRRHSSAGAAGISTAPFGCYAPARVGSRVVRSEEMDRVELALGERPGVRYTGYLRTPARLSRRCRSARARRRHGTCSRGRPVSASSDATTSCSCDRERARPSRGRRCGSSCSRRAAARSARKS